jgi:hypothetical protein
VHKKRLMGRLVAVQGPKDPMPRLYAAVAQREAYPSLEHETGHAEALVGDHLSVTNEREVEFQRRLTDGEIARLRLKAGEVKRFEIMGQLRAVALTRGWPLVADITGPEEFPFRGSRGRHAASSPLL